MKTITIATSVILLASFCCWKRSQGGVELLIVVGVDLNTMNDFHKTPLDYAKVESWAHPEVKAVKRQIADLLRKHGGKTAKELKAEGK
jgi:hypothetical protein